MTINTPKRLGIVFGEQLGAVCKKLPKDEVKGETMKYIWAVSMGIGENVSERRPMRIFSDKKSAYAWVAKHFADDILSVKNHADRDWDDGVTIGNSFAVRRIEVEEGED